MSGRLMKGGSGSRGPRLGAQYKAPRPCRHCPHALTAQSIHPLPSPKKLSPARCSAELKTGLAKLGQSLPDGGVRGWAVLG